MVSLIYIRSSTEVMLKEGTLEDQSPNNYML